MITGIEFVVLGIFGYGGMIGLVTLMVKEKMVWRGSAGWRIVVGVVSLIMVMMLAGAVGTIPVDDGYDTERDEDIQVGILWSVESKFYVVSENVTGSVTDSEYKRYYEYNYSVVDPDLWSSIHYLFAAFLGIWILFNVLSLLKLED